MKVKLKGKPVRKSLNDCIDGKFLGIDLYTWKKINQGKTVDMIEIPKEAEIHLVSIENKIKKINKKKLSKGESNGN